MKNALCGAGLALALCSSSAIAGGMSEPIVQETIVIQEAASSSGRGDVFVLLLATLMLAVATR